MRRPRPLNLQNTGRSAGRLNQDGIRVRHFHTKYRLPKIRSRRNTKRAGASPCLGCKLTRRQKNLRDPDPKRKRITPEQAEQTPALGAHRRLGRNFLIHRNPRCAGVIIRLDYRDSLQKTFAYFHIPLTPGNKLLSPKLGLPLFLKCGERLGEILSEVERHTDGV